MYCKCSIEINGGSTVYVYFFLLGMYYYWKKIDCHPIVMIHVLSNSCLLVLTKRCNEESSRI